MEKTNPWSLQHSIFLVAQCCIAVGIVYFLFRPPVPGWAVALLAVVAAAMSIHSEMRGWQKAVWMLLIGGLLIVEMRSITKDRKEATIAAAEQEENFKKIRATQNEQFDATAKGLKEAYEQSQKGFDRTTEDVGKVFDKTRQAADAAKEGVANITGGDSWGWVMALPFADAPNTFYFMVLNDGKRYSLRGIRLVIVDETVPSGMLQMKQCDMSDIPPHTGFNAPTTPSCVITLNPNIKNHFQIIVGAQNGSVFEDLYLTTQPNGPIENYEVYRISSNGKKEILKSSGPNAAK